MEDWKEIYLSIGKSRLSKIFLTISKFKPFEKIAKNNLLFYAFFIYDVISNFVSSHEESLNKLNDVNIIQI